MPLCACAPSLLSWLLPMEPDCPICDYFSGDRLARRCHPVLIESSTPFTVFSHIFSVAPSSGLNGDGKEVVNPLFSIEAPDPAVGRGAEGPVIVFVCFFLTRQNGLVLSLEARAGEVILEMIPSPHPQILSGRCPGTTLGAPRGGRQPTLSCSYQRKTKR